MALRKLFEKGRNTKEREGRKERRGSNVKDGRKEGTNVKDVT
jgi:hypothetical protein